MPNTPCHFLHFGLIVTGKTEAGHLPKLFKSLEETGRCHFEVILFAWCVRVLERYTPCEDAISFLYDDYRLHDGTLNPLTQTQLELLISNS